MPGLQKVVKAGLATAASTAGAIAFSGWNRLQSIEDAEAKLTGLGHSAEGVQTIMDDALAAVKGTAFGMGEAATVAATAVAAGIKPGQELERTLTLIGDAATIGGTSMAEMGSIFNKVATDGRIQADVINQLNDRGIPIITLLADQLGVASGEVRKLAADGKISFEDFQSAMEAGMGGAALASGKTMRGAFANMKAAAGRLGATMLRDVYPMVRDAFNGITSALDNAEERFAPVAERIGKVMGGIFSNMPAVFSGFMDGEERNVAAAIERMFGPDVVNVDAVERVAKALIDIGGGIRELFGNISQIVRELGPAIALLVGSGLMIMLDVLADLAPLLADIAGWFAENTWAIWTLAGAYGGLNLAMKAHAFNLKIAAAGGLVKYIKSLSLVTGATKAWAAVQWVLNGAMKAFNFVLKANPIVRIAVILGAVVGAFVTAYKTSETFRKIVDGVLRAIGNAFKWLWESAIKPAVGGIVTAWHAVGDAIGWVWNSVIKPVWDALVMAGKVLAAIVVTAVVGPIIAAWNVLSELFKWWWNGAIKPVLTAIGDGATWLWEKAIKPAVDAIVKGWDGLVAALKWAWENILKPTWEAIQSAASWLWEQVLKRIFGFILDAWGGLTSGIMWGWDNVLKPTWDAVESAATWLYDNVLSPIFSGIASAWEGMSNALKWAYDNIISPMIEGFKSAVDGIVGVFNTVVDGIKGAWNAVKAAIGKPIYWVIDTVWNKGILAAWDWIGEKLWNKSPSTPFPKPDWESEYATGGILPGYTPGRDVHRFYSPSLGFLNLSGGEAIMRPEVTRALGPDGVNALNAAARSGGASAVRSVLQGMSDNRHAEMHFADGGIIPFPGWLRAVAPDWMESWIDKVNNNKYVKIVGDAVKGTATAAWDALKAKIVDLGLWHDHAAAEAAMDEYALETGIYGTIGGMFAGGRLGRNHRELAAFVYRNFPGARITSALRNTNDLHGAGKAVDIAGPYPAPFGSQFMADVAAKLYYGYKPQIAELIYNGIGKRTSNIKNSSDLAYNRATQLQHRNHVHLGVYDNGGVLEPGLTAVANKSGKPEAVFNADQWRVISQIAEHGTAPLVGGNLVVQVREDDDVRDQMEEAVYQLRRIQRGGGVRR